MSKIEQDLKDFPTDVALSRAQARLADAGAFATSALGLLLVTVNIGAIVGGIAFWVSR